MNILVLGIGGFIGSHLTRAVLTRTDWHVRGIDLHAHRIADLLDHPRLTVRTDDVFTATHWITREIRRADVCLPLAATASYVRDPLATFDLDFAHNLDVVRRCAAGGTRVVFPSTSEVYGLCPDAEFDEDTSPLVYGPVGTSRWIYAASKQLLDRVILALAQAEGLRYTLFRPFNWTGPGLDDLRDAAPGAARVVTQFLGQLIRREPITLVDGGTQRRCFTHVDDGVDGLMRILANPGGVADGRIFNLGHPGNDRSIRDLAETMIRVVGAVPGHAEVLTGTRIVHRTGRDYYGPGYQDVPRRVPAIHRARDLLGWTPRIAFEDLIVSTVDHHLRPVVP